MRGKPDDPSAMSADRSDRLNYEALQVSIPRDHELGKVEWPDTGPADPAMNFMTTDREALDEQQFIARIRQRARSGGPEAGAVLVFVHGYNNLYQESVYRFAQILHDGNIEQTGVLFSWPSRGKTQLYLADRESTEYSRDYLEHALLEIAAIPEVHEINLLAHSMGNWLAVEALRQAKMKGHGDFGGKLNNVVLASPDIDVNVFRTQLDVIGHLRKPITVMVSGDDKALSVSTLLAGDVKRVGIVSASDPRVIAAAAHYNVRVIDLSNIQSGDPLNHDKFAESGAVISAIGRGLASEEVGKAGIIDAAQQLSKSILSVPASIVEPNQ
ncbi:MAG: alpha/beta hydrolase [Hyphomicrobium sp.]